MSVMGKTYQQVCEMSDAEIIAWARDRGEQPFAFGSSAHAYRRLADLAEKGTRPSAMSPALKRLAADLLASAADGLDRIDNLRWPTYLSASDRRAVSDAVNALGDPALAEDYAANRKYGPRTHDVMACLAPMLRAEVGQ